MKIIRARVADHFAQIAQDEQDAEESLLSGLVTVQERIRTYNFPSKPCDRSPGLATLQNWIPSYLVELDEVVDAFGLV